MSYRRTHATHSWITFRGNLIVNEFICFLLSEKENCITTSHGFNNYKSESNFLAHMWQSVRVCGLNIFTLSPLFRWTLFCFTFKWHIITAVGWWPLNHLRLAIIKLCLILGMKQFLNDYSNQEINMPMPTFRGRATSVIPCPIESLCGSGYACLVHLVLQMQATRGICWAFNAFSIQPPCVGYDFKSNTVSPWLPVKITKTSSACFSVTECELSRLLQAGQGEASYLQALQGEMLNT